MIYNFNRTPPPNTGQTLVNKDIADTVGMTETPWARLRLDSKPNMSLLVYGSKVCLGYLKTVFSLLFTGKKSDDIFTFYPDHKVFAKAHWFLMSVISEIKGMNVVMIIHSFITYERFTNGSTHKMIICSPKPGKNLYYIPNTLGVERETKLLNLDTHKGLARRVGFFSGGVKAKGIDTIHKLSQEHQDFQFVYGGKDWGYRGDNLKYFGTIDSGNISDFFSQIDVFYFPSAYHVEFSPVVLLEAMCAGRVVVSSAFNNIDWMLPQKLKIDEILNGNSPFNGSVYRDHYLNNFSREKRDLALNKIFPNE
ncbi:MAG: hypothetical protein Roseis2KO_22120 [Roseivirga sp.]